jgi:hypothetical protein
VPEVAVRVAQEADVSKTVTSQGPHRRSSSRKQGRTIQEPDARARSKRPLGGEDFETLLEQGASRTLHADVHHHLTVDVLLVECAARSPSAICSTAISTCSIVWRSERRIHRRRRSFSR